MLERAVITGASAGLGAEFARQLAAEGYGLILVARRREKLEALARELGGEVEVVEADLADRAAVEALAERLAARSDIGMLVNNAGFGTKGNFADTDWAAQVAMHEVHVFTTMRLTRAVLPAMLARNRGAVINVASVAGFSRSAGNVSYCATKAWMVAFTEGLYLEMANAGAKVTVQALCPGFTYTEFHDVMGVDRGRVAKRLWMRAEDVVRESLRRRGRVVVVPGWVYKFFVTVFPRLPVGLRLWLQIRSPHKR